jgi:hypothetical protein
VAKNKKFENFKQKLVDVNEAAHGAEARAVYGAAAIDRSNAKIKGMTEEQHAELVALSAELNETLKRACNLGDPASELAAAACEMHRRWLCFFWDTCEKEAHLGIAQMYVDDTRFTEYYEKIAPGCAVFLRDAVRDYYSKGVYTDT